MWELYLCAILFFTFFCILLETRFLLKLKILLLKVQKFTRWTPKYNRLPFYVKKLID